MRIMIMNLVHDSVTVSRIIIHTLHHTIGILQNLGELVTSQKQTAIWERHSIQWRHIGVPLKPSDSDSNFMLESITHLIGNCSNRFVVGVLGVTPEVIQLKWPSQVDVEAFDHSSGMIDSVWQPNVNNPSRVTHAFWQTLPIENESLDAIVGDGSFNVLLSLGTYIEVLTELHRTLKPNANIIVRCFIRPLVTEKIEAIIKDVNNNKIESFHALKWRIAMMLADNNKSTVAVNEIYACFERHFKDRNELMKKSSWLPDVINTINAYKNSPTIYTFPTLDIFRGVIDNLFTIEKVFYGEYELSDKCPTLILKKLT